MPCTAIASTAACAPCPATTCCRSTATWTWAPGWTCATARSTCWPPTPCASCWPSACAKPILLAESGAVEPRHSGPFKLYQKDQAGIILHDVLFAPFFAGAAGPGHIWHWDVYVDRMNLWHHFARFAKAVEGIDPAAERFQPAVVEHPRLRILALKGQTMLLAWCRDSQNTWQSELADGRPPQPIEGATIDLKAALEKASPRSATAYDPWENRFDRSCAWREPRSRCRRSPDRW